MIAPETEITLYKTDVEIDELNNIKFNTWTDQWNYFSNLPKLYLDEATYQRKEGVIRYPNNGIPFDELLRYNYVSYKNSSYSSKTFFAFIKNMRYVNDGMTEIEIESDVWQTWQFDIIYRKCFTEREHVKDDTYGLHTIPEALETGEYITQEVSEDDKDSFNYIKRSETASEYERPIIVMATSDTNEIAVPQGDQIYGNCFSGLYYLAFPTGTDATSFIYNLTSGWSSKIDSIYAIFMVPYSLLDGIHWLDIPASGNDYAYTFGYVPFTDKATTMRFGNVHDDRMLGNNYIPKNNKALCFPYRYFTLSNNAGQTNHYKYELFQHKPNSPMSCDFKIEGTVSIGCNIKAIPINYNMSFKIGYNEYEQLIESLDGYKLPTCTWLTDPFLNWLSENSINIVGSTAVSAGEIIAGAAMSSANPAMAGVLITGGAASIFNTIKEGVQKSLDPAVAHGGQNQGNYNFAKALGFSLYKYSVKDEYAKIIDDYFSMFGYKVNALKVPEIHSRKNWNYVKTIDCNFSGDIPGSELEKIRDLFNRGITLWHNPSTFLDYSQSNQII